MEWYDKELGPEYELLNRMVSGLCFEKEEKTLSLRCYMMPDETTGISFPVSFSQMDSFSRKGPVNIHSVLIDLGKQAMRLHETGSLPNGVRKETPETVREKRQYFEEDMNAVREEYEFWQDDRTIDMSFDRISKQLNAVLMYQYACAGLSRDDTEKRTVAALYAQDRVEYYEANEELTRAKKYELTDTASNGWSNEKIYCFESFMTEGSLDTYLAIVKECKEHGMEHAYDIGCCTAFQAKLFRKAGIEYTGIDVTFSSINDAPKGRGMEYLRRPYPFPIYIRDKDHSVAVSNLCLGYLIRPTGEAYTQLAKDFRFFCGAPGPDGRDVFKQKFGIMKSDKDNFVCWADREKVREADKNAVKQLEEAQDKLFGTSLKKLMHKVRKGKASSLDVNER